MRPRRSSGCLLATAEWTCVVRSSNCPHSANSSTGSISVLAQVPALLRSHFSTETALMKAAFSACVCVCVAGGAAPHLACRNNAEDQVPRPQAEEGAAPDQLTACVAPARVRRHRQEFPHIHPERHKAHDRHCLLQYTGLGPSPTAECFFSPPSKAKAAAISVLDRLTCREGCTGLYSRHCYGCTLGCDLMCVSWTP